VGAQEIPAVFVFLAFFLVLAIGIGIGVLLGAGCHKCPTPPADDAARMTITSSVEDL
jgi:hypothetical protein